MKISRRELLKQCVTTGLGLGLFGGVNTRLFAADDTYNGPLWVMINAKGGWDVTSLCDPKGYRGAVDANNPDRINNYDQANIGRIGNLSYAPPPDSFLPGGVNFIENLYSNRQFFEKYYQQLLVINGIDCKTNSHSNGQLFNFSGRLRKGYPAFAALVAGVLAPHRAFSFISNGGYAVSADLITPVRMNASAENALYEIAYANRSGDPRSPNSDVYLPDDLQALIHEASQARHDALLTQQIFPRTKEAIKSFIQARAGSNSLRGLANNLQTTAALAESTFNGRRNAFKLYQQGRLALAAYEEGIACSVDITLNGFDTHADHDARHYPKLMDLLQGVDAIIEEAKRRNLQNNIVIVMLSDFGRTNKYNKDGGKDHWPISSAMLIGNSQQTIPGNRAIGVTTEQHKALKLDPISLAADFTGSNSNAIMMTPAHIHSVLRQLAGIDQHALSKAYALDTEMLNLFA